MTSASPQTGPRPPKTTGSAARRRISLRTGWTVAGLLGLTVVAVTFGRNYWLAGTSRDTGPQPGPTTATDRGTSGDGQRVRLPAGKARATRLSLAAVTSRVLQRTSVVPGRVAHNSARRIELRAPAEGTVLSISVKPSDHVNPGDVLAVLQIPEIGTLRASVLQRQAELALALRTAQWEKATYDNLESLTAALERRPSPKEIQQRFGNRILGKYRERVISAYSRFVLADRLTTDATPLAAKGVLPGRTLQERTGARDVAEAVYRTVREQSLFDAHQARDQAQSFAENARRQLAISQRLLAVSLGYDEAPSADEFGRELAVAELRAPIAGTVEERHVARTERFDDSEPLFVIADTTTLIIKADIREKDWAAITLQAGTQLDVEIPALSDGKRTAILRFVGRQVDAGTRSVPLVASIDNPQGLLRPGLFVRIRVPLGPPRKVLAVPTSAIMRQGDAAFVFRVAGVRTYRKSTVQTGIEDEGWTEIVSGVKPGDRIVDQAAFVLKSEMLLEGEQE